MKAFISVEEQSDGASSMIEYAWNSKRVYQDQAMAVISTCQLFSLFVIQERLQATKLREVLKACDDVLRFAAHSDQDMTHETNQRFQLATQTLSIYASRFHPGFDTFHLFHTKMTRRRAYRVSCESVGPAAYPDPMVVDFVLFRTLPDPKPIVVRQMLRYGAGFEDVLWNFAHLEDNRRISLHDNPHFYAYLPTSSDEYTAQFRANPMEKFRLEPNATIYILVDQPRRIFFTTRQGTRIFSNVFMLNNVMVFKDIHGVLEGESVVGESLRGIPDLWLSEKLFVMADPNTPPDDLSLPPISRTNPTAKQVSENQKKLIRRALSSGDDDLHIYVGQLPPLRTTRIRYGKRILPPPPPTSERPVYDLLYTNVDMLNNDILLAIFYHYRLANEGDWNRQLRWCKLSHVCRKWRHIIHQSSFHLNMHILFMNGTPLFDMLSHLPPFPFVIDYRGGDTDDDRGILHAIQDRNRVLRIVSQAPSLHLSRLIVPMDGSFPRLESLSLLSTTSLEKVTDLMLPRTFLAPNLCHLSLRGVSLPQGLPLLASTFLLVTLSLTDIQSPGYFTPATFVSRLQHLPQLEELSICFFTPLPRPGAEGEFLQGPITLTTLPALRFLVFRGVSAYLENLIARINTPLLERFNITLFNQLIFTLPHLSHFARTTETLRHPAAKVVFNREGVSFVVGSRSESVGGTFNLRVSCKQFDWQIDSATQVCSELVQVLSAVEELTLDFEEENLPPDWQNEVDAMMWHGLLWPFNGVKKLHIGHPFASELSNALESDDAGLILGLLPELEELEAQVEPKHVKKAFETFMEARQLAGRHIRLSVSSVAISTTMPTPAEDELPVPSQSTSDEDERLALLPAAVQKNWFRRAVVEPFRRRLRSRPRLGVDPPTL